VVGLTAGVLRFLNQVQIQEPLDCCIERARAHTELVVRNSRDRLHNGVAVLLPLGQREENKKDRGSEREQVLQVIWNAIGRSRYSYVI